MSVSIDSTRVIMFSMIQSRSFSDWIYSQLERTGMSIAELSKKSDVSRQTIYVYMRDNAANPSINVLDRLADALVVSRHEIYHAAGIVPTNPQEDEDIKSILHLYRQLNDNDKEAVELLAKALLSRKSKNPSTQGE